MYLTNRQLRPEMQWFVETGQASVELCKMVATLCAGVCQRYGGQADDLTQEVWLTLLKIREQIKLPDNLFSYISTIAINSLRLAHREKCARQEISAYSNAFSDDYTTLADTLADHRSALVSPRDLDESPPPIPEPTQQPIPLQALPGPCPYQPVPDGRGRHGSHGHLVTLNGRTQNIKAWLAELGISRSAFTKRCRDGMTIEEALRPNLVTKHTVIIDGVEMTLRQACIDRGANYRTVLKRLGRGMTADQALTGQQPKD